MERIGSCREPERFAGWLLQIVRNRSLNCLERRRLRDVPRDQGPVVAATEAPLPESDRLRERLFEALTHVSAVQREVVLLHDLEEWTHVEIGAALGISAGMSRQHLFHARRVLRKRLSDQAPQRGSS
jgi:RNA polymerase sigma-70 factor (ECF subfamily)